MSEEPIKSTIPTVLNGRTPTDTIESLDEEGRILPPGYRVAITHEPSMVMRGKTGEMITVWYQGDMLTRHIRYV
jgi:hypothetical protein